MSNQLQQLTEEMDSRRKLGTLDYAFVHSALEQARMDGFNEGWHNAGLKEQPRDEPWTTTGYNVWQGGKLLFQCTTEQDATNATDVHNAVIGMKP